MSCANCYFGYGLKTCKICENCLKKDCPDKKPQQIGHCTRCYKHRTGTCPVEVCPIADKTMRHVFWLLDQNRRELARYTHSLMDDEEIKNYLEED